MTLQVIENPYYLLPRIYVANWRLHPRRRKRGAYVQLHPFLTYALNEDECLPSRSGRCGLR